MAKLPPAPLTPDIIQKPLEEVMHQSMMPYAEYVILAVSYTHLDVYKRQVHGGFHHRRAVP